jgi:hypothetical protein
MGLGRACADFMAGPLASISQAALSGWRRPVLVGLWGRIFGPSTAAMNAGLLPLRAILTADHDQYH